MRRDQEVTSENVSWLEISLPVKVQRGCGEQVSSFGRRWQVILMAYTAWPEMHDLADLAPCWNAHECEE